MHITPSRKQYIIGFGVLIAAAIGLYGLLPQLGNFADSWQVVRDASAHLVLAATVLSLVACVCSAGLYQLLSFKRLPPANTLIVQFSGLFVNRVLPAGVGGLGLNFLYLRANRHTTSQASAVVALNNLLGFVGHALLTLIIVGFAMANHQSIKISLPTIPQWVWWLIAAVSLIGLCGLALRRRAAKPGRLAGQLAGMISYYRQHPGRLLLAVGISMLLTLCNVSSLWLCCEALHLSVSFLVVFLVFTFGVAAGTAIPTPGGIGGAEAALTAGLISQHISSSTALAAALLYRLVSFWFGLLIGALAFGIVESRHLLRRI